MTLSFDSEFKTIQSSASFSKKSWFVSSKALISWPNYIFKSNQQSFIFYSIFGKRQLCAGLKKKDKA